MAKKTTNPVLPVKFWDEGGRARKECPECGKFSHARSLICQNPDCDHHFAQPEAKESGAKSTIGETWKEHFSEAARVKEVEGVWTYDLPMTKYARGVWKGAQREDLPKMIKLLAAIDSLKELSSINVDADTVTITFSPPEGFERRTSIKVDTASIHEVISMLTEQATTPKKIGPSRGRAPAIKVDTLRERLKATGMTEEQIAAILKA